MIRNLKLLGLMAIAVTALSAMLASAAQAETGKGTFTSGETEGPQLQPHLQSEVAGEQITESAEENFLEAFGQKTTCKHATYTGTSATGEALELTLEAAYKECTNSGLVTTVTMNGCAYVLKQPSTIEGDSAKRYTGLVDVECPVGKKIEVHVYLNATEAVTVCTLTIPAQTKKSHIVYKNASGARDDLTVEATVGGLKVERDKGTCGEAATTEAGVLKTNLTAKAYRDNDETKTQTDLWISEDSKGKAIFTSGETEGPHLQSEVAGEQITESAEENFLEAFGQKTTCKHATYTGTSATGEALELTLEAAYKECTNSGLVTTVTMNGCAYVLKQPSTIEGDSAKRYTGLVDVECPVGKKIEVHVYLSAAEAVTVCTLTIPAQINKSHIVYKNASGARDDLTVEATVGGLRVERDKGACGEAATTEAGVLKTNLTAKAYKDNDETKTQTDLWISDPEEGGRFTAGETPKTHSQSELFGNQITELPAENFFEFFGEAFACKNGGYTGTSSTGNATELTLETAYAECHLLGGFPTFTMNGCAYILRQPGTILGDSEKRYTGTTAIECPEGKKIELHLYLTSAEGITLCTFTIPAQSSGTDVVFRNTPSNGTTIPKDALEVTVGVSGLKVERTKGNCGEAATTEKGLLATRITVRAYKDEAKDETKTQTDLWISDPASP